MLWEGELARTLTIRDLDEATADRLRSQAARSGRTPEVEAREILTTAIAANASSTADAPPSQEGLAGRIQRRFAKYGGVDIEVVRVPAARPVPFAGWFDEAEE